MTKSERAGLEINAIDRMASLKSPIHSLYALSKLFLTVLFITVTVSFGRYDLTGLSVMVLFPVAGYVISGIPLRQCFIKLRIVMPLVCAAGIVNPFLDREIICVIGGMTISGGVISMITLMLKGVFSLMMSFLLIATTPIEEVCLGLRKIHIPGTLVSLVLLTYRYVSLLLREAAGMNVAYHLKAPGDRGIRVTAWGSFLGQLLLRASDRASRVYDAMKLRGYNGEFYYATRADRNMNASVAVAVIVGCAIVAARIINVAQLLGGSLAGGM